MSVFLSSCSSTCNNSQWLSIETETSWQCQSADMVHTPCIHYSVVPSLPQYHCTPNLLYQIVFFHIHCLNVISRVSHHVVIQYIIHWDLCIDLLIVWFIIRIWTITILYLTDDIQTPPWGAFPNATKNATDLSILSLWNFSSDNFLFAHFLLSWLELIELDESSNCWISSGAWGVFVVFLFLLNYVPSFLPSSAFTTFFSICFWFSLLLYPFNLMLFNSPPDAYHIHFLCIPKHEHMSPN